MVLAIMVLLHIDETILQIDSNMFQFYHQLSLSLNEAIMAMNELYFAYLFCKCQI